MTTPPSIDAQAGRSGPAHAQEAVEPSQGPALPSDAPSDSPTAGAETPSVLHGGAPLHDAAARAALLRQARVHRALQAAWPAAAAWAGYAGWGWRGLILAFSLVVFWLLLQASRALRTLRAAASRPLGHVGHVAALHARLQGGWTLQQVLQAAGSLGVRAQADGTPLPTGAGAASFGASADAPAGPSDDESWRWDDAGGAWLVATFVAGRLLGWRLHRPAVATTPQDGALP